MREQKYADILKEYEKEDLIYENETKEEKLSMTRELKFEELHKALEDQTNVRNKRIDKFRELDVEKNESKEDIKLVEDELTDEEYDEENKEGNDKETLLLKEKLNSNREEAVEQAEGKREKAIISKKSSSIDEDIYLTTSFKPPKLSFRIKKGFKVTLLFLVFIALIGVFSYYVVYPIYNKYINSKPKMIFDGSVDAISKVLIDIIEEEFDESEIFYSDYNFKINSNIDGLDLLSHNTYGYRIGVDPKNKLYQSDIYIIEGNNEYGVSSIHRDGKYYYKYSTSDSYLDLGEVNSDELFDFYLDYFETLEDVSKDDLIYLVEKEAIIAKELFEKELMTSEKDEMEINGKKIKVVKNSYEVDKRNNKRLQKKYAEKVIEDEKLLKIKAVLEDMEINEYKDFLQEVDEDEEFSVNIYTVNGTKVVGFDIEENGFRNLYYYSNDGDFEFHFNFTEDDDCLDGNDCVKSNQRVIDLKGTKEVNHTAVVVSYNGDKIATLKVKSFNKEKIDFDYEIEYKENKFRGDLLALIDYENESINIDMSYKQDSSYINLSLFVGAKNKGELAFVDKNKLIKYTDKVNLEEANVFSKKLYDLGVLDGYQTWYFLITEPDDFYEGSGGSDEEETDNTKQTA